MTAPAAPLSCVIDEIRDCGCRRRHHHEFRHKRQFGKAAGRCDTVDRGVARIHQPEFTFEVRLANITQNGPAHGGLARTGSDQRDRTRAKADFSDGKVDIGSTIRLTPTRRRKSWLRLG